MFCIRRRSAVRSERTCLNNGSVRFSCLLFDLWLAGAPCDFLLDSCEGACVDDCRVIVLDIVFVPFAVVCLNSLADTVGHISVIYTVHMESGKKMLGYDRETAYLSKAVAKERNTAQRFLCPLCRICDVSVMDR